MTIKRLDGWVAIWRTIRHHFAWEKTPFAWGQAWIDLILRANHEEGHLAYLGNTKIIQKRGEVLTSLTALARSWGWSRHKVSDFLNLLEREGMLTQKRTGRYLQLFLVNYERFQPAKAPKGQSASNHGTSDGQPADTINNENNANNEKNSVNFSKKEKFTGVQTVINHYISLFESRYGRKPEIAYGKYGKLLKDKLRRYSVEELCELLNLYAESDEAEQLGFTLDLFLSAGVFNKLIRYLSPEY